MDYKARFYSPTLGRFTQPDTIIPSIENPQDWNRYSYVLGNPIRYADPTGHCACALLALLAGGAIATVAAQVIVVTLVAIAVGVAVGLIVNALTASTPVSMMGRKEHNRGIYYPKPATVDFNIDPRRPDPGRNDQKETSEEAEATKAACRSRNLGVCLVIGGLSLASTVAESTGNSFEPNPAENKKPVVQASRYTANPRVGGRQIYYDDPSIRDRRFETD